MELNANELKALADKQTELMAATKEFKAKSAELSERMLELEQRGTARNDTPTVRNGYLAKMVQDITKSEQAKAVADGKASKHGFDFNAKDMLTKSAIISDLGDGNTLPQAQRAGIVGGPALQRRLRMVMPMSVATSGTVEWVRQTNGKQLAEPQFAGSPGQREAVPKKESSFTFALAKTDVVTLAHHTTASRQVMDDEALLQAFITGELLDGVERELEREILQGDGTDGEFEGFAKSGNSTALTGAQSGDNQADLVRRAIAQLENSSYVPDAIIVNPLDWADIELIKSQTEGDYVIGVPRGLNPPSLWGLPVYSSEYQPQGEFYVASLAQSCRLWVRQEARILMSDSHGDNFTSNLLTWLAELRACITVVRPGGIISGSF